MRGRDPSSTFVPTWLQGNDGQADSDEERQPQAFARLWRAFMAARVLVAVMLLLLQVWMGQAQPGGPRWLLGLVLAYLISTVLTLRWSPRRDGGRRIDLRWTWTLAIDIAVFGCLQFFQPGSFSYTPLFVLPLLLGSVLGSLMLSLATAAAVTLFLLFEAGWSLLSATSESTTRMVQTGLTGTGFFLVAFLANQLAQRLAREEAVAYSSQLAARTQARVNELVIEGLSEGVLVIDRHGRARHANPAAQAMLYADATRSGAGEGRPELAGQQAWDSVLQLVQRALASPMPLEEELRLDFGGGVQRTLLARTHLTGPDLSDDDRLCVVFLEDLREMEARVRTEKLAAMGRMSAAVAHEIRNPLAAISQANALLDEELSAPTQRRLTRMIDQNAQRLARIVDDVLNVARLDPGPALSTRAPALALDLSVHTMAHDWAQQNRHADWLEVRAHSPGIHVAFDPEHLRRLLVNLLDNALRYASGSAGSICVRTAPLGLQRVRLSVWSDGAPLDAGVRRHLFEPFFSSESRSSGLGLYICRQLCESYGAQIGYQRAWVDQREGNEFTVDMPRLRPALPPATETTPAALPAATAGASTTVAPATAPTAAPAQ